MNRPYRRTAMFCNVVSGAGQWPSVNPFSLQGWGAGGVTSSVGCTYGYSRLAPGGATSEEGVT